MKIILILIVSFVGFALVIHTCAKNNYTFEYSSNKRKIKVRPVKDKPNHKKSKRQRWGNASCTI